ncbi:MAG: site-specific integrase, partial [Bacteroidota bacterium]
MKQLDLKIVADEMLSEMSGITRASENTLEAYSRDIKEFVNFCSEKEINSIDRVSERTIRHFIIRLNENESTKSTISRKLSSLRRLFLFAIKNEYIEKNPIRRVSNPRIRRKIPEIINVDSYLEIFSLVDKNNVDKKIEVKEAKQIKAIFELLYGCALR